MRHIKLADIYQREILPALFERLDRAFPEFHWTQTLYGWKGQRIPSNGSLDEAPQHFIMCIQPWAFVDEQGVVTSWLSYVNGGEIQDAEALVEGVKDLAQRAGVHFVAGESRFDHGELNEMLTDERQRTLLEAFFAYCHAELCGEQGDSLCETLQRDHGILYENLAGLPLGLYTTAQEIAEHLLSLGFTRDELIESALVGDPRLPGRLLIAWRDRLGVARTIVARDLEGNSSAASTTLYMRGGAKADGFGLDVALRPSVGGRDHLLLVDTMLDVVLIRSLGMGNVATIGRPGQPIDCSQWERLSRCGVRAATLALRSNAHIGHVFDSIRQANRAKRAPQLYTLRADDFGDVSSAAHYLRRHGLEEFQQLLTRRIHGYRYAARHIIEHQKHTADWTDAALMSTLKDAVRFDAEVMDAGRVLELERFFWPTILEATRINWDSLRRLLKTRLKIDRDQTFWQWQARNLRMLLHDLKQALDANDYERFRRLLCAAADDLRSETATLNHSDVHRAFPHRLWIDETHETSETGKEPATLRFDPSLVASSNQTERTSNDKRTPSSAEIRALAYQLWEENGRPSGADQRFWYEAEQQLNAIGSTMAQIFPIVSLPIKRTNAA